MFVIFSLLSLAGHTSSTGSYICLGSSSVSVLVVVTGGLL